MQAEKKIYDKKSIEEVLTKSTSLTSIQTQYLLQIKNSAGKSLEEVLKNKKTVESALLELCKFLNISFLSEIPFTEIPSELVSGLPIQYAKNHNILPFKENKNKIQVLTSNPLDFEVFNSLKVKFKKPIEPIMSFNYKIKEAINHVYEKRTQDFDEFEDIKAEEYNLQDPVIDLLDAHDEAPIIKLVNTLLVRAVKERASDIHLEPYEKELLVRFRVDGNLYSVLKLKKRLQNAVSSRIKIMGKLNIAEKRLPQDGSIPLRLAGKDIDIRLNTVPTSFGERLVLRLQDRSQVFLEIDQLGFSEPNKDTLNQLLEKNYGIILATGPTGSGKSSTLYACVSKISSKDINIITIEDPVEQRIHGVGQIQVSPKIGLTFAKGLRSILRQDPDVIMVGEIRDLETMKISINASLTGHLVLSTLHTNDSAGVFPRLIDMGCEPFLIATSLLGVISQRLVRVLCPHCKEPYKPSANDLNILGTKLKTKNLYKAKGCNKCNYKGYLGRTAIAEVLIVNDDIRSLILQNSSGSMIKKKAISQGMITFREHGLEKVTQGLTTIEEVLSNTQLDV
ncbi:MAG: type II secretion system ATPase GspE [Bdellovibrionaceae bacterium]|nr:type II secretion system ATPase GspE [Pseudobdellovibrionaceae bacterium]